MEVFRPQQISFRGKPILSSIISGAVVLLLDLSQLGIVGCLATLLRSAAGWAHRPRQWQRV
jgi:hypothetical protein